MEKIIKALWEHCKSSFINWVITNIWKLFDFGGVITLVSTIALIQEIPSFYWIPMILLTCYLFIAVVNGFTYWYNYFQKPVLEIIYDNGKYNGPDKKITWERGIEEYIDVFAYRVKVCNSSNSIIHGVEILVEIKKEKLPCRATFTKFRNTEEYYCDIYPKSCEIVTLLYWRGELTPIEATIKCRGKEISEKIKTLIL